MATERPVNSREDAAKFLQQELARANARTKALEADKVALVQEFIQADDNKAPEVVRKHLKRMTLPALDVIEEILMDVNVTPGVRASLAKYVIDRQLTPLLLGGDPAANELKQLLAEMAN